MPKTLVTGATGFVGRHLVQKLVAAKESVRIMTRKPDDIPEDWKRSVEVARGDLMSVSELEEATRGVDLVYHLAGELRAEDRFWPTNVDGARNLVEASARSGVGRLIHLSSVGVMGPQPPGPVDERTPYRADTPYEKSKMEGERLVLETAPQRGIRVTALRPTIVFGDGPRRGADSMLQWLRAIQAGRFAFVGRGAVANYVYVGDVVDACIVAASKLDLSPSTFIVSDPCPLDEFVRTAAASLGVPPPRRRLPRWLALALAAVLHVAAGVTGRSNPLTIGRVRALSNRTWYVTARIERELQFKPRCGYREGLTRTVAWYRAAGKL